MKNEMKMAGKPALVQLRALVSNDTHAAGFQSCGQYRAALLRCIDELAEVPPGWQLMPMQMTEAMKDAAKHWTFMPLNLYTDLLQSAPQPQL